jgi:pimeloyl-ACP methyl ester carboxylesterase
MTSGEPVKAFRRYKRRTVFLIAPALILACVLIGNHLLLRFVAAGIVRAPNAELTPRVTVLEETARLGISRQLQMDVGPPAARISVWIIDPAPRNGVAVRPDATILVAHGIHSNKRDMLGVGRLLADNGFRAVLVDLRGHGESTGDLLSFGVNESRDLSQLLDRLEGDGLLTGAVGAYGASFGGATVLLLAGRDERVKAVTAVCPFSSMREIIPVYVRRYLPAGSLLPDWWIRGAIERAGQLAEFDPDEASPLRALRESKAQVLLIHGRADEHIPFGHSRALHAAAPTRGRLILLDGENHASIMQDRSGTLSRETVAWFRQWLVQGASSGRALTATTPAAPKGHQTLRCGRVVGTQIAR